MTQFTMTCGLLIRRQFRNQLESFKFQGGKIEWHESKSLLNSQFIIKGDDDHIRQIFKYCETIQKEAA